MSEIVNLYEAKTHLSRLVDRAAQGEEIVIAKAGKPKAKLVPFRGTASPREPADLLGTFTADSNGEGEVQGKIDDDVDEVGSVSVRLGPGYETLQACAPVH